MIREDVVHTADGQALLVTSIAGDEGDPRTTVVRIECEPGWSIAIPLGAARRFTHFADEDHSPAARTFAESFAEIVALVEGLFATDHSREGAR